MSAGYIYKFTRKTDREQDVPPYTSLEVVYATH